MPTEQLAYVCGFLPLSAFLFYLAPRKARAAVLALLSAAFWFLFSPALAPFACAAAVGCYLCARRVHRSRFHRAKARARLLAGVLFCAALFAGGVYTAGLAHVGVPMLATVMLSACSALADLARGDDDRPGSFAAFAAYCLFFGKLVYGPLLPAADFTAQLEGVRASARGMGRGVLLFFTGLAQRLLLADALFSAERFLAAEPLLSLLALGMRVALTGLGWYFLLSGCSNMAQGAGLLFGLDLPRNHAYPFGATTLSGYFGRFLITQNSYAKAYIAPLAGRSATLSAVVCGAFAGLWLGLPAGAVWGAVFGLFIRLEGAVLGGRSRRGHEGLRRAAVFWFGAAGFVLLLPGGGAGYSERLAQLAAAVPGLPLQTELCLYRLLHFAPLLLLSLLLATRLTQSAADLLRTHAAPLYQGAVLIWGLCAVALSLSLMMQNGRWPV